MAIFSADLIRIAEALLTLCRHSNLRIATAESCTGGLIAACLTEIPGSSDVIERGFITYTNEAKSEELGVPAALIESVGAVSAEVAEAMAAGALEHSAADIALSATGIAGPGGATDTKPVGLVYLGIATRNSAPRHERHVFIGDRGTVRLAAVDAALALAASVIASHAP